MPHQSAPRPLAYCVTTYNPGEDSTREYLGTYPDALRYACWVIANAIADLLPVDAADPALPALTALRGCLMAQTYSSYVMAVDTWNAFQRPAGPGGCCAYVTIESVQALARVPRPNLRQLASL